MKRSLSICLALFGPIMFTGCLFSRKPAKPKQDPSIAANVEATFRQRWVERRGLELKAAGLAPAAAQAQAEEEFNARFSFATPPKK
jgi:hypothetical protein